MNRCNATRKARKELMRQKLDWILHQRDNPDGPITASTLLAREAYRLSQLGSSDLRMQRVTGRMAWAFDLAAAWLNSRGDPANLTRYRMIQAGDEEREAAMGCVLEYISQHEERDYRDYVEEGSDPRNHVYYDAAVAGEWGEVLDAAKPIIEAIECEKNSNSTS